MRVQFARVSIFTERTRLQIFTQLYNLQYTRIKLILHYTFLESPPIGMCDGCTVCNCSFRRRATENARRVFNTISLELLTLE